MPEPIASRPYMPGYGIAGPEEGSGLLPWTWAEERLVASHDYWVATTHPDGRPNVTPVWGVWAGGGAWFSSSRQSRKARNIATDARITLTSDNPLQPVIVEGLVTEITAVADIEAFTLWVNAKYETDLPVQFFVDNATFRLDPHRVFGLDESDFTGSPTRWVFSA
jgi:nitroimidazol reductase NimA-like FMN-containing flavoprotein (pyridoxamine 5'-phosphate oxidase superfamily)